MKRFEFGQSGVHVSEIALGCMRIGKMADADVDELIKTSLDCGIDFFDHADIYGGGKCEEVFAASLARQGIARSSLFLQSKCGIRTGYFDFSREWIVESVENILKRLKTDYLDSLLLHRPDTLMEPDEIADAFVSLSKAGKVRHFGVSNFTPMAVELLQASLPMRLHANQLQFSMTNTGMIDQLITANTKFDNSVNRDGGILEYSRLKKMTIQAWSPFLYGFFEGVFIDSPKYPELNEMMDKVCEEHGITKTGLAITWIQRHPAKIQSVIGTTTPSRVKEVSHACKITLSRSEWYELYKAAGNILP